MDLMYIVSQMVKIFTVSIYRIYPKCWETLISEALQGDVHVFPCSLKISNLFPCSLKVRFKISMFPVPQSQFRSFKIFASVLLFPENK